MSRDTPSTPAVEGEDGWSHIGHIDGNPVFARKLDENGDYLEVQS